MCAAYEKALAKYDHNDPQFVAKVDGDVKGLGQNCWAIYKELEDVVHGHVNRIESLAADNAAPGHGCLPCSYGQPAAAAC
ncbi:MAG: hypothetical protein KatS3mg112_1173 [Thermogutta sp.]|nr:MAG: hypothetical protein KatS3mg112_1173 [Thermogutta sp.]